MAVKKLDELSDNAAALYKRVNDAVNRQNDDYAVDLLIQLLTLEPAFLDGRRLLRRLQIRHFEGQNMLSRKMASVKVMPEVMKVQMSVKKQPEVALVEIQKALNVDPVNANALMVEVDAAEAMGLLEVAAFSLETMHQMKRDDVKVLKRLGEVFMKMGDSAKAVQAYEVIQRLKPNDPDAFKAIQDATAQGAIKGSKLEGAKTFYDALKDSKQATALEQESRVVKSSEMIDNLIAEQDQKLRKDPSNLAVARQLARLYIQKTDFDSGLSLLSQIQKHQGSDPGLEKEITDTQLKKMELEITTKEAAFKAAPENEALKQELVAARETRNTFMLEEAEKQVQRYPNDLGFRYELGVQYFQRDNVKGAIQQFQMAVKNPQMRVRVLNYLGQCFLKQKLMDIAVRQFQTALSEISGMDDLKKEVLYNLGLVFEAKGDSAKASEHYQQIYEVDMSYRDVAKRLGLE